MKKENAKVNVKKDNKNTKDKFKKGLEKIDQNRNLVFSFIGGALVVALITVIIWPDRIATLKDGTQPVVKVNGETITADFLYEEMKKNYSISYLIEYIDKAILDKKYEETDEMKDEIEKTAQSYFDMYEQYYGMDEATLSGIIDSAQ